MLCWSFFSASRSTVDLGERSGRSTPPLEARKEAPAPLALSGCPRALTVSGEADGHGRTGAASDRNEHRETGTAFTQEIDLHGY